MTASATRHFRRLAELLVGTLATDRSGRSLGLDGGAELAIERIWTVRATRKVLLVGNGGSAAIVSHMATDLVNRCLVRAMDFNSPPLLTALANDFGYAVAFERLAGFWAMPGDVLVAISSSGKSENLLRAARACADRSCAVITLTGFVPDNPLRAVGDLNFYVSSMDYGEVEVAHQAIVHYITDRLLARALGAGDVHAR